MRKYLVAFFMALLVPATGVAQANPQYPTKPVTLIVTFPPGGSTDSLARALGQQLLKIWRQPVVVENRPGASSIIGTKAIADAPADGYTIGIVSTSHSVNPLIRSDLPYDSIKDFTPISELARSGNMLLVRSDSPYKSVNDVITAAAARPGALSYGHGGAATSGNLAGELLKHRAGVDITAVAFKGGNPALVDLIGGHITMSMNPVAEALPHMKSGALRALAVTSTTRDPMAGEIPTMQEAGVKDFDNGVWYGVLAPKNLNPEIVRKLQEDIARALKTPEMIEASAKLGFTLVGGSSAEFAGRISGEMRRWEALVKAANMKAQ